MYSKTLFVLLCLWYGPWVRNKISLLLLLLYMQGWIFEFRCSRQTLRKGAYILHIIYRNVIRWKKVKLFILSGNLLLRESIVCTVNCLKSSDFKLFVAYTLKLLRGTFAHSFALFWQTWLTPELKCGSRVINKLFDKRLQN